MLLTFMAIKASSYFMRTIEGLENYMKLIEQLITIKSYLYKLMMPVFQIMRDSSIPFRRKMEAWGSTSLTRSVKHNTK